MAEIFITAAAEGDARARGLAEALRLLGFKAEAAVPAEAELGKAVADAKCVLAVWQANEQPPAWVAAAAALALDRKTLVSLELGLGATPSLFRGAPLVALDPRDRAGFKARFEALVAEIEKIAPREVQPPAEKTAEGLARAMGVLAPTRARNSGRNALATVALVAALVFAVGFGAGRIINAIRSGDLFAASTADEAAATTDARLRERPRFAGLTAEVLETVPLREAAQRIDQDAADQIIAAADRGDALAQTLACLGHMTGAQGFLPSPAAARQACDAAAGQGFPAALYLSWALYRTAPRGVVDEATARARLRSAAEQGWLAAQLDYAQLLAADFHGSIADQTTAGQLLLAAAERGDARGLYQYARWLRDSPAGPRDPAAAAIFLQRAADAGQPEAMHMLATLARDGLGVPRDLARAKALYERAAALQHAPSMYNLAVLIDEGSEAERTRAVALYRALACMPDERQIQPMATRRLREMNTPSATCG